MRTNIVALSDTISQQDVASLLNSNHNIDGQTQRLYPVLGSEKRLEGVVTRKDLQHLLHDSQEDATAVQQGDGTKHVEVGSSEGDQFQELLLRYVRTQPVVAYPDESLRAVMNRMAETDYTRLPVVERNDPRKLVGMISLNDLLKARGRNLVEEHHRERVLHLHLHLRFPSRNAEKVK